MKYFFQKQIKKVKQEGAKDPIYHFFIEEKAAKRKRVYDTALKAADQDQKHIIEQFDKKQKEISIQF